MQEYGYRCGTNEDNHELGTLIGNWYEERRQLDQLRIPESLPSQFGHYFKTTYDKAYNIHPLATVPEPLKNLNGRHPHAFPRHQPELDGEAAKAVYNSWETTYRADYLDPASRKMPITFWTEDHPLPFPPSSGQHAGLCEG
ncbi:cilia- and flagella-associated protein 68-like isoform X2 [Babylonia areolata]